MLRYAPSVQPKRLLLVDAYGLIYRAFHAIPPLTNSRGILTNAAFGFASILLRAIADASPQRAIVAFDAPGATHRHERFPAYKAQRPSMPDELRSQVPLVRDLVAALGLPLLEAPGYEADDVIGTIAEQARSAGWEVLILSGDLDMLQLVGPGVSLLHTARGGADAMVTLNRIYTRTGDAGETALGTGERVSKAHLRIQAYGTVDETNAAIGLARSLLDPNEIAVAAIAMKVGHPVRWIEDRREHLLASVHARDHTYDLTISANADGTLLGIEGDVYIDAGAYSLWPTGAFMEASMASRNLTGPYRIRHLSLKTYTVATNKAPMGPYRGVARPGAA